MHTLVKIAAVLALSGAALHPASAPDGLAAPAESQVAQAIVAQEEVVPFASEAQCRVWKKTDPAKYRKYCL